MEINWLLIGIVVYVLVIVGHAAMLLDYANRNRVPITAGAISLVSIASIFWPIMWIWYGIDKLRGRVA